jgi:magnesium transporter
MAEKQVLEDDAKEKVSLLIEHRLPWLVVGLMGGIGLTLISSRFEHLLAQNIGIAYFIPVIVYMADAVGTQTENVFVRNLVHKQAKFSTYLIKEILLGLSLGALFGCLIGLFAFFAFHSTDIALTVGLAMFATMSTAPAIALIVPTLLQKTHKDPAVGAGPFTTVIQDFLSLLIYFLIATAILIK